MGFVGRFLRENLWPIVTLVTFGLTLWATLSITTLAQEKENQQIFMAKAYQEELRLAYAEGIFPPKPMQRPRVPSIPADKDAALIYAQIDIKKVPHVYEMKNWRKMIGSSMLDNSSEKKDDYLKTWMPQNKRNPAFDIEIDDYLQKVSGIMDIAQRASNLPLSSIDTKQEYIDGQYLMPKIYREFRDIFFTRIYRNNSNNLTQSIKDLETITNINKHYNGNYPQEYFESNAMYMFRNMYKSCYLQKKYKEREKLLRLIRNHKTPSYEPQLADEFNLYNTYGRTKMLSTLSKKKDNTHQNSLINNVPTEDALLDINSYFRFLDSMDKILSDKIYIKNKYILSSLAYSIHEIRVFKKKTQENPERRSPRQEWKFCKAIDDDLKKYWKKKKTDFYLSTHNIHAGGYLLRLTQWYQTLTMIALYDYKEKYGVFPQNLNDLPKDTPINDPIMEKPFLWKEDPERGWILYSPSFDEVDNGGKDNDKLQFTYDRHIADIVVVLGK
jgi:hypothetical protein